MAFAQQESKREKTESTKREFLDAFVKFLDVWVLMPNDCESKAFYCMPYFFPICNLICSERKEKMNQEKLLTKWFWEKIYVCFCPRNSSKTGVQKFVPFRAIYLDLTSLWILKSVPNMES